MERMGALKGGTKSPKDPSQRRDQHRRIARKRKRVQDYEFLHKPQTKKMKKEQIPPDTLKGRGFHRRVKRTERQR